MLPPMNALVAFEAAGRFGSFLKAAEELRVTPGAVSRQIQKLESFLSVALFVRSHRQVELTNAGLQYWTVVSRSLATIRSHTDAIRKGGEAAPLRIVCSSSFLRHWLLPRLVRFNEAWPSIDVTFSTGHSWQPTPDGTDVRIMLGVPPGSRLTTQRLIGAGYVVVCAPQYLKLHGPLAKIEDLAAHTLLHSEQRVDEWERWLGDRASAILKRARIISLRGDGLSYAAALEGIGVALGRICFVAPELMAGRLVQPLALPPTPDDAYHLVSMNGSNRTAGLKEFRTWIAREARLAESAASSPHARKLVS
jgi:LysR family glycine cleavage system transcriptional activator